MGQFVGSAVWLGWLELRAQASRPGSNRLQLPPGSCASEGLLQEEVEKGLGQVETEIAT